MSQSLNVFSPSATFPRRKRYSWYRPEDTLQDRRVKAERRRTQLLEECSTDENDDQGMDRWLDNDCL